MNLPHHQAMKRKWIFPISIGSLVFLFLLFLTTFTRPDGIRLLSLNRSLFTFGSSFVEPKLQPIPVFSFPPPPRFAYLISGSAGDGKKLKRTLLALYHPNNRYIMHLDRKSSYELSG